MTLRRNASGVPLAGPFLPHEVAPDEVVDLPDEQADGSPLLWSDELWPVVESAKKAEKE